MTAVVHQGYGRTRRPKALTPAAGVDVTNAAPTADTVGPPRVRTTSGHFTENQRFLHVTLIASGGDANPGVDGDIMGYCSASGKWTKLQDITFPDDTTPLYSKIFIAGIDRVYVKADNAIAGGVTLTAHLACSTF